jgi:hypothetical protein
MATIKSYTDLEQSRKLAEILPIESADTCCFKNPNGGINYYGFPFLQGNKAANPIPCWSLAALLDILPDKTCVYKKTYKDGRVKYQGIAEGVKELILKDNPVDACVAMVEKLNELKIL